MKKKPSALDAAIKAMEGGEHWVCFAGPARDKLLRVLKAARRDRERLADRTSRLEDLCDAIDGCAESGSILGGGIDYLKRLASEHRKAIDAARSKR